MKPSQNAYDLIKKEEGCVLTSYKDSAGVWTIGIGSTMYKTGKRVGPHEKITQEQADELLEWEVSNKSAVINGLLWNTCVNQNQFDSLVSLVYNIGVGAFQKSTLLKTIRLNPNDPYIKDCFLMWTKITVGGKKVASQGLIGRRKREYALYIKPCQC